MGDIRQCYLFPPSFWRTLSKLFTLSRAAYLIYLTAAMPSMYFQEKDVEMDQPLLENDTSNQMVWHHETRSLLLYQANHDFMRRE